MTKCDYKSFCLDHLAGSRDIGLNIQVFNFDRSKTKMYSRVLVLWLEYGKKTQVKSPPPLSSSLARCLITH